MSAGKWKGKRPMRSMTAITWLLAGAILLLWGVSMVCMTVVTAQELYDALYEKSQEFGSYAGMCGQLDMYYDDRYDLYRWQYTHPGQLDNSMLEAIRLSSSYSLYTGRHFYDDLLFMRDISIPMETAVLFYDKNGNILHENGNFVYFWYAAQEAWDEGKEEEGYHNYGWIDIGGDREEDPYARFRVMYAGTSSLYDIRVLRITGTVEGTEVKPAAVYYLTDTMLYHALEQTEPTEHSMEEDGSEYTRYDYVISDLDRAGLLEWQLQFDNTAEAENRDELVTIYGFYPDISIYEGSSLPYHGEQYDSLLSLIKARDFPSWEKIYGLSLKGPSEYGLDRILCFNGAVYQDWSREDSEPELIMVTAIVSYPLRAAISGLRNVYIGTGLLALVLILILRSEIKKHLVGPIQDISAGMGNNWGHVYTPDRIPPMWLEANALYNHYTEESGSRRFQKNEITRLNTALNYAKQAERERRQMTSNIAHELKTPLAVVHSYAEGLKEQIAEEKREQYLDVILSESERMDAMVLEMLDLSRLEAGKVKLSRDEFSLSQLARSIFDRLEPMARERGLAVSFDFEGDCVILADEARIGQVITNFASNAIKYTPKGGSVLVKTSRERDKVRFSVENDSEPFSQEALAKVWDAFYRADKARSGAGTGLGLAIARSILELHGGACAVRNTKTGVEFSFTLSS